MLYIHATEITSLPPKEFSNVDTLDEDGYKHRAGDKMINIILLHGVANKCNLPEHHTKSAIRKLLNIPAEDARI